MTSTPHPATREYRRQVVRIADLVVTEDVIMDVRFENCQIIGPAVLAPLEGGQISGCSFDAPDSNALIWSIPSSRPIFVGAVGLVRVEFFACRFRQIGLAIPENQMEAALGGLRNPEA